MDDTMRYSEFPNSSDLISRQAVKELAHNQMREKYCGMALKKQRDFYIKLADSIIDLLPSIQPKRGKWIDTGSNEEWYAREYSCSECGGTMLGDANFCPNCGADMRPISALSENVEIASNLKRGES